MRLPIPTLQVCSYTSFSLIYRAKIIVFFYIAVAAHLALYKFTLKTSPPSRFNPNLKKVIPENISLAPLQGSGEWDRGVIYAQAQNLARTVYSFRPRMWLMN